MVKESQLHCTGAFEEALTIGAILNLAMTYYFLRVWIFQVGCCSEIINDSPYLGCASILRSLISQYSRACQRNRVSVVK